MFWCKTVNTFRQSRFKIEIPIIKSALSYTYIHCCTSFKWLKYSSSNWAVQEPHSMQCKKALQSVETEFFYMSKRSHFHCALWWKMFLTQVLRSVICCRNWRRWSGRRRCVNERDSTTPTATTIPRWTRSGKPPESQYSPFDNYRF